MKKTNFSIKIHKFLLKSVGTILPSKRHPLGKIGNFLRNHYVRHIATSLGKKCLIEKGADVQEFCVIGDHSSIGEKCLISPYTIIEGENMMGPNVKIYTNSHFYDESMHSFNGCTEYKPVKIGKKTWIGTNTIILPGVSIGNNTIIGAGSVVTKSIPSGVMAAGNPAIVKKIIDRKIYEESKHFQE